MDEIVPKSKRGGYRPGAGRPPKVRDPLPLTVEQSQAEDAATAGASEAIDFLRKVIRDTGADPKLRIDAAKALLNRRPAEAAGKKEQRQQEAMTAHKGTGWDDLLPAPVQ